MPSAKKAAQAVPFNAADVANIAKANPYIQRLLTDEDLRDNVRSAVESGKSAYDRLTSGKRDLKSLLRDKQLQRDIREAYECGREAVESLQDGPRAAAKKGFSLGRALFLAGVGSGIALAGSEGLRSKVLDTLFGAEEEFTYTPPSSTGVTNSAQAPTDPVSAA
jgi:hypothetical protein